MVVPTSTATRCRGIVLMGTVLVPTDQDQAQVTVIKPIAIVPAVVPMRATIRDPIVLTEVQPTATGTVVTFDLTSIGKIAPVAIHNSATNWMTFAAEVRSMTTRFAIA